MPFTISRSLELQPSAVVVTWSEDAGRLGPQVIEYLNRNLHTQIFAELDPAGFFSLGGVSVEDDVAQFPETTFYCCEDKNLVTFKSSSPASDWYRFLEAVLDVAQYYCHVTEIYTVGGMLAPTAHTNPRGIAAISNCSKMTAILTQHGVVTEFDYTTPPDQRPSLSSFLLWAAQRRNIPAATLWVPQPFYLAQAGDAEACCKTIEFFDERLNLAIDFTELRQNVARQNSQITELRNLLPEVDSSITKVENNLGLTQEENTRLIKEVDRLLKQIR